MPVFDLFSKRQRKLRGEVPNVLSCNEIPKNLRVQIVHIITDVFGNDRFTNDHLTADSYAFIKGTLCREYGTFSLRKSVHEDPRDQVVNFLLEESDLDKVIDVIELCFRYFDKVLRNDFYSYKKSTGATMNPDEAIDELNERFREAAVGYSYNGERIIRVDSTYVHCEITKPTISLLWNTKFAGANEEYLKAHEHYRHGRNKECLVEGLKAFESTLKIICHEKGWTFNHTDTARKLIQICFDNNLIPGFTQNQFTSLISLLETGIPTIRNKLGGHGQGQIPQKVDDEITRYALNLAGTNIIFLVEQSGLY